MNRRYRLERSVDTIQFRPADAGPARHYPCTTARSVDHRTNCDGSMTSAPVAHWDNWVIGAPVKRSLIVYDH